MIVWSFCILAFVTAVVALGHWGGKIIPAILIETPMPQTFWVKIIANVGAVLLLVALRACYLAASQPEPQISDFKLL